MTDDRMREVLEKIAAIGRNGLCPGGWATPPMGSGLSPKWVGCAAYRQSKTDDQCWCPYCEAQAALSTPARRTNYEWKSPDKSRWKVQRVRSGWEVLAEVKQYGRKKWVSQSYVPGEVCATAIATLAGLEKEDAS